jgi:hypothetical protein
VRDWSDKIHSGCGHDLRNDDHAKLDFAFSDKFRHDVFFRAGDFVANRLGNSKPLEKTM